MICFLSYVDQLWKIVWNRIFTCFGPKFEGHHYETCNWVWTSQLTRLIRTKTIVIVRYPFWCEIWLRIFLRADYFNFPIRVDAIETWAIMRYMAWSASYMTRCHIALLFSCWAVSWLPFIILHDGCSRYNDDQNLCYFAFWFFWNMCVRCCMVSNHWLRSVAPTYYILNDLVLLLNLSTRRALLNL